TKPYSQWQHSRLPRPYGAMGQAMFNLGVIYPDYLQGKVAFRLPGTDSELDKARAFLREELAAGAKQGAEVFRAGVAKGFKKKLIRRARLAEKIKTGKPGGVGRPAYWWLPEHQRPKVEGPGRPNPKLTAALTWLSENGGKVALTRELFARAR